MAGINREPFRHTGLIVNPSAGKGSGKGLALAQKLQGGAGVTICILERFEQLGGFLNGMVRDGVTDLFISSGDGTIQEILTRIAERGGSEALPRIGLLPHGTTNLSANDVGFRSHSIDAQAAFLTDPVARELCPRKTIRCANPGDGKVRHGMFVGTGAVAVATLYCQKALNAQGVKGQRAVAGTLLTAVRKYLFSAPDPADETRFDRPYPIIVEANGRRYGEKTQLLQMSTTLEKLVLGMQPFWGPRKGGAIRTTVLPYPVPSVLRWMLPVMYGGEKRSVPPGALSFCSDALTVEADGMFVIDGEFFPAPQGEPLRLQAGPTFNFVRG